MLAQSIMIFEIYKFRKKGSNLAAKKPVVFFCKTLLHFFQILEQNLIALLMIVNEVLETGKLAFNL